MDEAESCGEAVHVEFWHVQLDVVTMALKVAILVGLTVIMSATVSSVARSAQGG